MKRGQDTGSGAEPQSGGRSGGCGTLAQLINACICQLIIKLSVSEAISYCPQPTLLIPSLCLFLCMFVHKINQHQPFEIQKCQKAPVFTKMQISAPSLASLFQILKILSEKRASVKIVNFRSFFSWIRSFTGIKIIISKKL